MTVEPIRVKLVFMLMRMFRKFLLAWMILWLPIAGAIGAVMPISGPVGQSLAASSVTGDDQDYLSFMPCHNKSGGAKVPMGEACNHCVLCHLAGALAMPEMPVVPNATPTHLFTAFTIFSHPSFVPELPVPPPRSFLA